METLWHILDNAAARYGNKPALKVKRGSRAETWSYRRLKDFAERVAAYLRNRGIARGDRVLVWGPNMPEWVGLYFGCMRAGVIVVPMDVRSAPDFALRLIEQTEARCAFVSRTLQDRLPQLGIPVVALEDLPSQVESVPPDPDMAAPAPDNIAEVMFTSGTTGEPKGVVLTHRNIAANVASAFQVVPSKPAYRVLSLLPLSHMLEQTVGLMVPLRGGSTIVYAASLQPNVIFSTLHDEHITTMAVVPQVLQLFWDAIEREVSRQGKERAWSVMLRLAAYLPMRARRLLFRSVHRKLGGGFQFVMCGGAYLDPDLARRWELLGIPVLQGYGATEAAPIITANSMKARKLDSVGRGLPGQEIRIAEDGEVLVRGDNLTQGYWRNPSATVEAFEDGWYRTGDIGFLDTDGFLYLRGRKKDIIVLENGMNVHPQDIEEALKSDTAVRDACVVGITGQGGRVRVHAALLLDGTDASPRAIVERAHSRLAEHQRVQGVSVWPFEDFPRTHTLKIKKREVVDYLTRGERPSSLPVTSHSSPDSSSKKSLQQIVADVSERPLEDVRPSMTLGDDLGLDSLRTVELLSAIEAELGAYVDESQVTCSTTVAELAELVARSAGAAQKPHFWLWPMYPAVRAVRAALQAALVFPLSRLLMPLKVEGSENLKRLSGPVIFASNHLSHLDTLAVVRALPWHWRLRCAVAAAADVWFDKGPVPAVLGATLFNAFPFSRAGAVRPTLEHCGRLLDRGWSILIYPEGTRSRDGIIAPFKSGTGMMAAQMEVPVVPIYIQGTGDVLPKGDWLPRRGKVLVRFGPPLRSTQATAYADATQNIERAVRELAGEPQLYDTEYALRR